MSDGPEGSGEPRRIGRPKSETAGAHSAIMDAVYALLKERSVRELSMEAVAKRAGVGKPTLYKWWPTKAGLVFAMFHERLARQPEALTTATVEEFMRQRVRSLIDEFHDQFGKVIAELIAEGQSDPKVLQELYDQHIGVRRAHAVVEIEKGKRSGEFSAGIDAELLVDQIFGPIYYRMLLLIRPLDHAFGDALLDQVLSGVRNRQPKA
ncbi:MAG: TetR family transcriptional regulator [Phenylobacterium sp.]|jgi:AcrR family transcriptional regulator|nr:TetR family transcriptional regulator [Phenylobacterium sp.]